MRIQLSEDTISEIQDATGKRITRNGDQIIRDLAIKAQNRQTHPPIMVCDQTEKFSSMEVDNEN